MLLIGMLAASKRSSWLVGVKSNTTRKWRHVAASVGGRLFTCSRRRSLIRLGSMSMR